MALGQNHGTKLEGKSYINNVNLVLMTTIIDNWRYRCVLKSFLHCCRIHSIVSAPNWDSLAAIIDMQSFIAGAADFYGHNDMDMVR